MRPFGFIALCSALVAGVALGHGFTAGPLTIGHPWMRPTIAGAPNAAGYLSIHNAGHAPDRLTRVTSSNAIKVEIHQSSMVGGIMRMRLLPDGVEVPAGKTVAFAPGGYHLMLVGPKRAFKLGDHIDATLEFQHAGPVRVWFLVQADGTETPMSHDMGQMH